MKRLGIVCIAIALACGPALAIPKNAGTSGGQFLKIGAGARPTAMGDAFVAVADDVNAVYYNPAGLGLLKNPEMIAMHTQYLLGINYDFGAYAQPLKNSAFAISAATLKTDEIARRNADESLDGTFQNQDAAYAFSYAHTMGETAAVGLSARWIREEIAGASAQTWSSDIGIIKRFEHPFSVGLAVRHLGGEIKFNDEGDPLPLTVDGGVGMHLFRDQLNVALDVKDQRDAGIGYGAGLEWHQSFRDKFRYAARCGYNSTITDANGSGISLGLGAGYRHFDLDFAWIPFGDLGNTFRYAAHIKF